MGRLTSVPLQRPRPAVLSLGTNLSKHSTTHVNHVTAELNDRPRKGLRYRHPSSPFRRRKRPPVLR